MAKKNPLYVVTQKGGVVEEATGYLDALIKKLGLTPLIELMQSLFQMLMENVTNYASLEVLTNLYNSVYEFVESLWQNISPKGQSV